METEKYKVVSVETLIHLETQIAEYIKDGFQPYGDLHVTVFKETSNQVAKLIYTQVIVKPLSPSTVPQMEIGRVRPRST